MPLDKFSLDEDPVVGENGLLWFGRPQKGFVLFATGRPSCFFVFWTFGVLFMALGVYAIHPILLIIMTPFFFGMFHIWLGGDLLDWKRRENSEYSIYADSVAEYHKLWRPTQRLLAMDEIVDTWIDHHKDGWATLHIIPSGPQRKPPFNLFIRDRSIQLRRIKNAAEVEQIIRSRKALGDSVRIKD